MIKTFNSFPILITKNGKRFNIIEFHLQPIVEFDQFVINDLNNEELLNLPASKCTELDLPAEWGEVEFVYKLEGQIVSRYQMVLSDEFKHSSFKTEKIDTYAKLKLLVQSEIERPNGSETEKDYQSDLIHQCTISEEARLAMMSKIRHILMRKGEIDKSQIESYTYKIFSDLWGMGVLQELDDDPEVGEISVNAREFPYFDCNIYYHKNGVKYQYDKTIANLTELKRILNNCVAFEGKELNNVQRASVEATRPNKDRVTILQPKASENYMLTIRKFANFVPSKESMYKSGTINEDIDKLFEVLVAGYANIGIGGAMNTGKTSLISFLLTYTNPLERKFIIANVSETDIHRTLRGHDIVVAKVDEDLNFTFEGHMRTGLRATAKRIIVPESRGAEFRELFEACYKTKGNMFTGHCMDDNGFMTACVDMYMSSTKSGNENSENIKNKLTAGIDIVVVMREVGEAIRIKSISEVIATDDYKFKEVRPLIYWKHDPEDPNNLNKGCYVRTEHRLSDKIKQRLNEKGVPMRKLKDL